ncbi:MAG: hypothetical protein AAB601_00610, partial [Patescibacteria group bacterium]
MRRLPGLLLLGGLTSLLLVLPGVAGAFGVSPPFVNVHTLLRGSRYEATVFLVQGRPESDRRVRAIFDVPEKARSWFSTDQASEEFTIPQGVQQFPLKIRIRVPESAENGVYNGYLRVTTIPSETGGTVSIAEGVR